MQAGLLRQRITINQKQIAGTGDRGQTLFSWIALYVNVPAHVEELTGRKLELARQLVASATHKVSIRYLANLSTGVQVICQGRTFNVGSVQDKDLLHFTVDLICTEEAQGP